MRSDQAAQPGGEGISMLPGPGKGMNSSAQSSYAPQTGYQWQTVDEAACCAVPQERSAEAYAYKLYIPRRKLWHHRVLSIFLWSCTLAYLGMFIASLVLSDWQLAFLRSNPMLGPSKDVLVRLGATATYKIQAEKEWWRIVSSVFLCAGTLHIWALSSALWTFGHFLSAVLSPWQLILVFAMSGLAGVTASANIAGNFITSAAGGPIFGLIGGSCAALLLHRKFFVNHVASWSFMVLVLALNVYMGATPFVDNACNVVGFVAGALSALGLLLLNRRDGKGPEVLLRVVSCCLLALVLAISVVSVLGLLVPEKSPVQGCCDAWVCVSSPQWDCDAARVNQACVFSQLQNGTELMYCPRGAGSMVVPNNLSDSGKLSLCDSACSGAVSSTPSPLPTD